MSLVCLCYIGDCFLVLCKDTLFISIAVFFFDIFSFAILVFLQNKTFVVGDARCARFQTMTVRIKHLLKYGF